MKHVVTIVGIRPDFIRMSEIFRCLDRDFKHTLINTGQHYDKMLCDVFFDELNIRKPDYNLEIGGAGKEHFHQNAELTVKLIELLRKENIQPDMILFLGDSNSVLVSASLRKEGYRIGHIEAGMRSYDRRMLEETNRIVCDHCSDHLFVYHEDYKQNAMKEGIEANRITVCGNTIVEVVNNLVFDGLVNVPKQRNRILLDIHRPENFKYPERLKNIIVFANLCHRVFGLPVHMLNFKRTTASVVENDIKLGNVNLIDLMSFKTYVQAQYHANFIISDSGTAQEETALLHTPVIVPRDFTERPQSMEGGCSFLLNVNTSENENWVRSFDFVRNYSPEISWLGDGRTSEVICKKLGSL